MRRIATEWSGDNGRDDVTHDYRNTENPVCKIVVCYHHADDLTINQDTITKPEAVLRQKEFLDGCRGRKNSD